MSGNSDKSEKDGMAKHVRRLYAAYGKYKKTVAVLVLLGLISNILYVISPQYLSAMTDSVSASLSAGTPVDLRFVSGTAILLVVLYAVGSVLKYLMFRKTWTTEEEIGYEIRTELSRKVSHIPVSEMDSKRKGDILSRFVNDTDTIRLRSTDCIVDTVVDVTLLGGTILMMFATEWRLALVSVVPTLLGFLAIRIIMHFSQGYFHKQSEGLGNLNTVVEETFRGLEVIRTYNGLEEVKEDFDNINDDLLHTAFRSRTLDSMMPLITGIVNNLTYVLVCVVGSLFILEGSSTFGTIVAFIVYLKMMNQPLNGITRSIVAFQEVAAASKRIFAFLDTEEMDFEPHSGTDIGTVRGNVVFEDVCFSYVPGREVIHHLSINVEEGRKIAIVGPTGAGKTTISNLLLRFYEPDSGRILIDGVPISQISRGEVREMFGVVLQETWIFQGTLRENLTFGSEGIPDEVLEDACRAVGLEHYLDSLPEGMDAFISDPMTLSSGQRQQITIARALIKNAPMLILDEATSSVDTRTEKEIQHAMDSLMEGRTSFIIAHRLSTIKSADLILVIDKGKIREMGTHQELLALGGFYRNLYDSQFEYCD